MTQTESGAFCFVPTCTVVAITSVPRAPHLGAIPHSVRPMHTENETLLLQSAQLSWVRIMWMRSCAICKALLRKARLWDSIRCQCGWEWEGHPEYRGNLIEFQVNTKKSA